MFEFKYNKYKRKENKFDFEYPENLSKTTPDFNFSNKWEQLDSTFHQKKKLINFFDENLISDETKFNTFNTISEKKPNFEQNFDFQNLIHPIDNEFDKYIKEKMVILEKIKTNNNDKNKEIINTNDEFNQNYNFIFAIRKYKNNNESLIKRKNEPILIIDKNRKSDLNYKLEFNLMKNKKFFFSDKNENNDTDIGKRNKMRLSNLLNKLKKENLKTEIINIPNKFNILYKEENDNLKNSKQYIKNFDFIKNESNKENKKDYFDTLLEQINIKKNKSK